MKSFSWIPAAAAAALAVAPVPAAELRQQPKAVLELFTSQGCNSCPQADALLTKLSQRKDIITLAYHVDYWDYVGWADTFGSAENSEFQREYARSWGSTRIYTPQIVVNGRMGVIGSRSGEVDDAITDAKLDLPVSLAVNGGMLEVTVGARSDAREATIWLVTYKDSEVVSIERGENAGKTMNYTTIVTGRQVLGMWEPDRGSHLKLPLKELMADGSNGAVILIQEEAEGLPGPILGASSVQL
ncbi:MAG TPA: DUF1223 domain-containing protein [Devosia sp.]|nr:DUF1223 domain-containing protein [Devosia sp.]